MLNAIRERKRCNRLIIIPWRNIIPFQELIGNHFGVDVKGKGDHFWVGIISGSIWGSFQGWGSFRGLYSAGDILLRVTLRWTDIPSRMSSNTPRHASCYGNRYKLRPFGPLARVRLYLYCDLRMLLIHENKMEERITFLRMRQSIHWLNWKVGAWTDSRTR